MAKKDPDDASEHRFSPIDENAPPPSESLAMDDLKNVTLPITADLGSCRMQVRDILELKKGAVVTLDKLAGEMTDLYINKLPLARGEVVVIGDTLHVRIGEIIGTIEEEEDDTN